MKGLGARAYESMYWTSLDELFDRALLAVFLTGLRQRIPEGNTSGSEQNERTRFFANLTFSFRTG